VRRQSQQANAGTGEAVSLATDASESKSVQAPAPASPASAEKDTSIDSKTTDVVGDRPAGDGARSPFVDALAQNLSSAHLATPEAKEEELMEDLMEDSNLVSDGLPEITGETVQQTGETVDSECTSKNAHPATQDEFLDHPSQTQNDAESSATVADSEHAIEAVESETPLEASESTDSLNPGFAIPMDQRQSNDLDMTQESDSSAVGAFAATEGSQVTVGSGSEAVGNAEADEHAAESVAEKPSSVGYNEDQPRNEDIGEVE
jgi:hypothetical protein